MRFAIFILFAIFSSLAFAQTTDYKIYRKQNQHPTCTVLDSVIVNDVLHALLVLDTNQFDANLDDYYQDLAGAYYQVYLSRQDTALLRNSLETSLKIKAYTNLDCWNMMHIHCMLGECQKGAYYLGLYRAATPLELQTPKEEEISRIQRKCQLTSHSNLRAKRRAKSSCYGFALTQ